VSGKAAAAGCWGTGREGGWGAAWLPAGEGGFRSWLDLNSSSAGSVGLGDALSLILRPDPARSRPPAQPLVLLCAANPTPSGRGAGLMPQAQMGPGDPSPHLCKREGMVSTAVLLGPSPGGSGMLLRCVAGTQLG